MAIKAYLPVNKWPMAVGCVYDCVHTCLCVERLHEHMSAYVLVSIHVCIQGSTRRQPSVSASRALKARPWQSPQGGRKGQRLAGRLGWRLRGRISMLCLLTRVIAHVSVDCQTGDVKSLNDVAVPLLSVLNVV